MPSTTKQAPHKIVPTPRNGPAKWPGITAASRALGVTRGHLYNVLEGNRESRSLLTRYRAWARANSGLRPRLP